MKITQAISLDAFRENSFKIIHAKQFDENARFIKVTVLAYGEELSIETGSTVVFGVKRADGATKDFAGSVNADGTVTVPFPNWMLQLEGICVCDISIVKSGEKFSTLNFNVQVEKAPTNSNQVSEDENYDILVSLIQRVEQTVGEIETLRDTVEDASEKADNAAKSAEDASKALQEAQEEIEEAKNLAQQASTSAQNAQQYAQEAKGYRDEFIEALDQIEGGVPKDIKVIETQTGEEKMVLVDKNGDQIGEGTSLPDSGAMGLESELVNVNDVEMVELWLKDKNGERIPDSNTRFMAGSGGGGGGASATTITIERITPSPLIITPTETAAIEFNFSSVDTDGQEVDGYYTLKIGSNVISSGTLNQGYNKFDVSEYVTIGTTKFTLAVQDDMGSMASRMWNVQVVDVRLETSFDDKRTYEVGKAVRFTYVPYGAIDKVVHFKLDGAEIGTSTISSSGTSQTYNIPAQTHGAHLFECYITASINGKEIETEHIYKDIIWFDESSTVPIIGCIYRGDYYGTLTVKQFNSIVIPFYVIDPQTGTPTITKEVDGSVISTETLESSLSNWSFKTSKMGEHTLVISCRETSVEINIEATDIGFDVSNVEGSAFDFNPVGLSNSSSNRLWVDANNSDVHLEVSGNFDWQNGGYQIDEEGNQYFCVKAGTTAQITYKLFENNAKLNGGAFKMVFKTANVRRANAQFLSCKTDASNDNVGLVMNVHEAYLSTSNDSLYIPYCEDDVVEFEYNINALNTATEDTSFIMSYEDGVGLRPLLYDDTHVIRQYNPVNITIGSPDCDVHIYRMRAYENSLQEADIMQNFIADARTAEEIISRHDRNMIFNENNVVTPESVAKACPDLKIIKIDCPYFTQDKSEFIKNTTIQCIHTGGDAKLDNWTARNCYHSGQGTTSNTYGYSGRNIDILMCFDGTYKNKKIDGGAIDPEYITELTMGDGTKYSDGTGKVSLTRNSVPNNYFNIKVNIASSENANNALLAKRFNDYLPYKSPAQKRNPLVKNTMEFVNCVVFVRENSEDISTHREFNDTEWHFYALGNMGDSKNTDATRVNDANDAKEFVVEIADNTLPNSIFQTGYLTTGGKVRYPITQQEWDESPAKEQLYNYSFGESKAVEGSYEFRYESKAAEDDDVEANKQVWRDFYEWVIMATDEQFKNELSQWFIEESALYFYLFTERYTMMDNRAKNTFWHYGKVYITQAEANTLGDDADNYIIDDTQANIRNGYRFEMWDYDNDTALGINNSGVLGFPYGKEDIDYQTDGDASSGYVFNGAESVFFCRIRDLMHDRLQSIYKGCESAQAWSAEGLITEFDNWQNQFPEELWKLDTERKYYRTYYGTSFPTDRKDTDYLKNRMNGRKKYQRRQWERDQESYMGSKYVSAKTLDEAIKVRCTGNTNVDKGELTANYTLKITPYSDMYVTVMYGNTSPTQQRAKAGETVEITTTLQEMTDTQIIIYNGRRIQALDDLSLCYIREGIFSEGIRLQKLVIGSDKAGYENTVLNSFEVGNNPLLEELNLQNCSNLKSTLNLSSCGNLKELYAEGSGITGVLFATGGKLSIAHLPDTVTSLTMSNLQYITDFEMVYDNLQFLTIENCAIDEKAIIIDSVDTLRELRLVGVDWTGDKSLQNTDLLNDILELSVSELYGRANITGQVRTQELADYANAWQDFEIDYNPNNLVEQYLITYKNDAGTTLYQCYVDRGSIPPDPVDLGLISTPTKASTEQYTYSFTGWNEITSVALEPRTVIAQFEATLRTYTVKWYDVVDGTLLDQQTVDYGTEAVYAGTEPTNTAQENVYIYSIFAGWDKSTGCVRGNMNVYAQWQTASLPSAGSKDLKDMSVAEINAVSTAVANGQIEIDGYFEDKDYKDIILGNDLDFNNVESEEIVSLDDPVILDGTNIHDTGVTLFGADDRSFTMAIDYRFAGSDLVTGDTLVSCYDEEGAEGFRLMFSAQPKIEWGDKNTAVGNYVSPTHYREMVVIRHVKGSNTLYVYSGHQPTNSNGARFADTITMATLTRSRATQTNTSLVFGAVKYPDGGFDYYGKGMINWCKIWFDDLGDTNARELASWCRETLRLEYSGTERYRIALTGSSKKASMSFVANNLLGERGYWMNSTNTNVGGWDASAMRTFCNNRLFNAMPKEWRSMIKKVRVLASAGNKSTDIVTSEDKIYLLSNREMGGWTTDPYGAEANYSVPWFTSDQNRVKFKGRIIPDGATYYRTNADPSADTANTVKPGDVWIHTGASSVGQIYVTQDELDALGITPNYTAAIGGGWISAVIWWERSPYASNTNSFMFVNINGNPNNNIYANYVYGVCPCFSI